MAKGFATEMDAAAAAAAGLAAPSAPKVASFTASTGFAAAVAADLLSRARAYGSEFVAEWPGWVEPRVSLLSELAIVIASRGDRDPTIAAMAVSGGWKPGRHVEALVASILVQPQPRKEVLAAEDSKREAEATAALPNAAALLYQFISAVVRDVVEDARRIRDRAASELLAVQPDHRIEQLETARTKAELTASRAVAEAARASKSEEILMRQVGAAQTELRFLFETINPGQDPDTFINAIFNAPSGETPDAEPEESRGLPKGIRQKGENKWEALIYRGETVSGRQRSCGSFPSIGEAVAARDAALKRELEPAAQVTG